MSHTLAWPVRIEHGQLATVEVGSHAERDQTLAVLLATTIGERPDAPQFGCPQLVGSDIDALAIQDTIDHWLPGLVTDIQVGPVGVDGHAPVTVEIVHDIP